MLVSSESIVNLVKAKIEFSKKMAHVTIFTNKEATIGKGFSYKYADLTTILSTVTPFLNECGLTIFQTLSKEYLTTTLAHESGEYIESYYSLIDGLTSQQNGSQITYARRYSISAMLSIATEVDDDGKLASEGGLTDGRKTTQNSNSSYVDNAHSNSSKNISTSDVKGDFLIDFGKKYNGLYASQLHDQELSSMYDFVKKMEKKNDKHHKFLENCEYYFMCKENK